jgi:hypothetical protein
MVWTSNHTSNNMSQMFIGDWDHAAALAALAGAPARTNHSEAAKSD